MPVFTGKGALERPPRSCYRNFLDLLSIIIREFGMKLEKSVMVSKMMQLEKPQNHCYGACFPLEIAPQLPYVELGWLHDVADHYRN